MIITDKIIANNKQSNDHILSKEDIRILASLILDTAIEELSSNSKVGD